MSIVRFNFVYLYAKPWPIPSLYIRLRISKFSSSGKSGHFILCMDHMTLEDFIELGDYIYKVNMRPSENETNVEW